MGLRPRPSRGERPAEPSRLARLVPARLRPFVSWRSPLISLGDQLLASGGNFVSSILIARLLGLEGFGFYSLIWVAILFAMALQHGAVISPMMSLAPLMRGGAARRYLATVLVHESAFCLVVALGIAGSTALFVAGPAGGGAVLVALAAVAGALYVAQDFARRLLFTRGRPHLALVIDVIHQGGRLGALAWLLWAGGQTTLPTVLLVLGGAAAASLLLAVPLCGPFRLDWRSFGRVTRRQWLSARWLTLSGVVLWVSANSGVIATGTLLGPAAVAGLRAAQTVVGMLNVMREALENILPQLTARHYAVGGVAGLRRILTRLAVAVTAGAAVLTLGVMLYGDAILRLTYGDDFATYGTVLGWLALTFPLALLNLAIGCAFRALERAALLFRGVALAAAINVVAIVPAVYAFGVPGAVGVILVSELTVTVLFVAMIRKALARSTA